MLLWESLLLNHIIPSIFDAAASLLLVLLIFKVFKVKNPATRFMFLFLPLLKAFIVFIDSSSTKIHAQATQPVWISIRMPDPFDIIKTSIDSFGTATYDHSIFVLTTALAICVILLLLVLRWLQLFLFFNKFKKAEQVSEIEYPQLYTMLTNLSKSFDIKSPDLVFSNNYQFVPFSIGYKRPIIVLSRDLVHSFPNEQLEIMLAHELAHIKRRDNLTGWIALILRDLMFYNPLIRLSHRTLEEEKEKTCDRIALESTNATPKIIANTLLDIAIFHKKSGLQKRRLHPATTESFLYKESALERRVKFITEPIGKNKPSKVRTSLKVLLFLLLLYIQPGLTIVYHGHTLFLR
ncbi:MAG: M56 family metallopeptidase [Candidatus Aquicultor sp.]